MSSGRDEMMSNWETDENEVIKWKKNQIQRMIIYRNTLIEEVKRLDIQIAKRELEIENEQESL